MLRDDLEKQTDSSAFPALLLIVLAQREKKRENDRELLIPKIDVRVLLSEIHYRESLVESRRPEKDHDEAHALFSSFVFLDMCKENTSGSFSSI